MNLSQGGHIQQIMVNTTDDSLEFKGVCRAEMKKKVQYSARHHKLPKSSLNHTR